MRFVKALNHITLKEELSECNGIIYKNSSIVVPCVCRPLMLKNIHYAHFGKEKCKALAKKLLYWPNMSKHIEDVIVMIIVILVDRSKDQIQKNQC